MDLKEFIKEISEYIKIPGIVLPIIFFLGTLKPISFISAGIVERKFFSKEKLFFFKTGKLFLHTLLWACVMFSGATFMLVDINENVFLVMLFLGELLWLLILSTQTNKESGIPKKVASNKLWKFTVVISFFVCLLFVYCSTYKMFLNIDNGGTFRGALVIGLILFLLTLPVPFLMKPVLILLEWYETKGLYWEDNEKNKWYLIHLIDKNSFLVGDNKDYILCNKTMLLKKEDLYGKIIKVEKNRHR